MGAGTHSRKGMQSLMMRGSLQREEPKDRRSDTLRGGWIGHIKEVNSELGGQAACIIVYGTEYQPLSVEAQTPLTSYIIKSAKLYGSASLF